ncbi:MAG: hypothetical protein AAF787_18760, partial [Chloroflexota bacterium]
MDRRTPIVMSLMLSLLLAGIITVPAASSPMQQGEASDIQILDIDADEYPTVTITTGVVNDANQAVLGLQAEDFAVIGDAAETTRVTRV